ncbi:MAG: LytR/AlgR family response regulator transcription factor [Bacteroidales bacterium]
MDQRIDTVIVDDDALCISCLLDSLSTYSNVNVAGTARTAAAGKDLILKCKPSLVFLDVELLDMTGLELLRELNDIVNWPMQVVFYTAYDKYLLDALRESAFDFMLKPFNQEELNQVMERFFASMSRKRPSFHDEVNRLLPTTSVIMVTTIDGFRMLHVNQVGYFRYSNDKKRWIVLLSDLTEVHLKKNTIARDILKYSDSFMQINRDQIINIFHLSMVKGRECILYPPFDKASGLIASSSFIGQLQERFSLI